MMVLVMVSLVTHGVARAAARNLLNEPLVLRLAERRF